MGFRQFIFDTCGYDRPHVNYCVYLLDAVQGNFPIPQDAMVDHDTVILKKTLFSYSVYNTHIKYTELSIMPTRTVISGIAGTTLTIITNASKPPSTTNPFRKTGSKSIPPPMYFMNFP